jgi:hypothetical protein
MLKTFKKELKNYTYNEIHIIDTDTGEFTHYMQDKNIGFIFSDYNTDVFKMGYKSITECLKSLRERNILGQEINFEEQKESERIGYIKLGVERIKRAGRINTNDFEDVCNKLSKYGMGFVDAQNVITAVYINELN